MEGPHCLSALAHVAHIKISTVATRHNRGHTKTLLFKKQRERKA
jgi:hypothetical protein